MNVFRRLWRLLVGTSRSSRSLTFHSGDQTDRLRVDWMSREWTREDGTMEREVWDRASGAITNYSSTDGGKSWALIP